MAQTLASVATAHATEAHAWDGRQKRWRKIVAVKSLSSLSSSSLSTTSCSHTHQYQYIVKMDVGEDGRIRESKSNVVFLSGVVPRKRKRENWMNEKNIINRHQRWEDLISCRMVQSSSSSSSSSSDLGQEEVEEEEEEKGKEAGTASPRTRLRDHRERMIRVSQWRRKERERERESTKHVEIT